MAQTDNKPETVTDIDGNTYKTVIIGTQTWMAENLRTTKYNDGSTIPNVTDTITWSSQPKGAYADYNNNPSNSNTYGKLYNYYAVVDARKLCPTGWHVPTYAEWKTLISYLGGDSVAGGKLKKIDTTHWSATITTADSTTGFNAIPGGFRDTGGTFKGIGNYGIWWGSTADSSGALGRIIGSDDSGIYRLVSGMSSGFSVRCVKD